jgi:hypothetical protein
MRRGALCGFLLQLTSLTVYVFVLRLDIYAIPWVGTIEQYKERKAKNRGIVNIFTCKTSLAQRFITNQNHNTFVLNKETKKFLTKFLSFV